MNRYRMLVKGLLLDPMTKAPVLILQAAEKDNVYLPIWIGTQEANAIILALENKISERPLTHELLTSIMKRLGGSIEQIVIDRMENNIYFAEITLINSARKTLLIDSRPSDAIALALNHNVPIFVEEEVIKKTRQEDLSGSQREIERLKEWMDKSSPDDFGKYKM
ncbi:MAG: bifunctional nuclease family protein [bacterium]